MAERNILAYFNEPGQAEGIASKLRALRAVDVQVDSISRYPGESTDEVMNPITGDVSSLATLTQGADISGRDAGVLIAADPAASGMSDGGGGVTGKNILLTAVVDDAVYEQALKAIQDGGGMV